MEKALEKQDTVSSNFTEADKQQLLQMSEISLWLDTYDDIFSDFDPHPYSERALSEDFLLEAQRASRNKPSGKLEIRFLIPADKREAYKEGIIKKRLKEHFKKHFHLTQKEIKGVIRQGIYFALCGFILMITATLILFKYPEQSLLASFLIVFFEPAGWYFFWEGLNLVLFDSKKIRPTLEFYEKMSKCEISFYTY